MSNGARIVLEVDGKQHYAEGDKASPKFYSEMVAEDRRLRLKGYEMYRFGGHELGSEGAADMLREFFNQLLARHQRRQLRATTELVCRAGAQSSRASA
ncbi:hypothetical protein ACIPN8_22025 [Streptomyces sp. NPDC086082]|uniref:hypothetical protein n=1 Tax=Streptomyces sp. NPDC086082 TaxID=3365750 RepID=UPI0038044D0A